MFHGIYTGAASMTALQRWQEAISKNLASSGVSGYKRTELSFEGFLSGSADPQAGGRASRPTPAQEPNSKAKTDFTPGELKLTGNRTDFAARSPGYFQLRRPDGSLVYTRNGEFHVNPGNVLVSKEGYQVQGDAGPVELDPELGPISITQDGTMSQGNNQLGRMALYDFGTGEGLEPAGSGYFIPRGGVVPAAEEQSVIDQGSLEMSNVSPLAEMVSMISVSRAYEASAKVISSQDELMRSAIQSLGSPN